MSHRAVFITSRPELHRRHALEAAPPEIDITMLVAPEPGEAAAAIARVPRAVNSSHSLAATASSSGHPPRKLIRTSKQGVQPRPLSTGTRAAAAASTSPGKTPGSPL